MYKLTPAVARVSGRNINMGHFISYVFTEDKTIMYDNKTVTRKIDKNLSREVCAVTYCLDHSPSTFLDDQANECENFDRRTTKENDYISRLFTEESEVDLGVVRLESIKALYHNTKYHNYSSYLL